MCDSVPVFGKDDRRCGDQASRREVVKESTVRFLLPSTWRDEGDANRHDESADNRTDHNNPRSANDTVRVPATMK